MTATLKQKRKERYRYPRPLGTTYLAMEYHKDPTPKNKETLIKKLLDHYLNNQLLHKDKLTNQLRSLSIEELGELLQIPNVEVMIRISKQMARIGNIFEKNKGDIARAIFLRAFNWALEGKALTDQQVQLLLRSQGGKYQAFTTSEVNKAIANSLNAQKPLLDLLKLFQGNTTIVPKDNADGASSTSGNNPQAYLTVDTALKLIGEKEATIINNPVLLEAKRIELGDIPILNPNLQGGDILRGQSLSKGTNEMITPEQPMEHEERSTKRRGIEEVEDEDEYVA